MQSQRTFLVTGAASGIGRALVGSLAKRGDRVLAVDLAIAALEQTAREDGWPAERIACRHLDVRVAEEWQAALDDCRARFGPLEVLVNVAGVLKPGRAQALEKAEIDLQIDVNFKGVVLGTAAGARAMLAEPPAAPGGHIVNIASMAALAPVAGLTLYSATKYAVRAFSLAAAEDLRPHGIAVTAVCPDAVRTPMLDLQVAYDEAALTFTAPRFLEPEDVVELILGKVLRRRPLLVALPRHRAWLARLGDLFPGLTGRLSRLMARHGRRVQDRWRSGTSS